MRMSSKSCPLYSAELAWHLPIPGACVPTFDKDQHLPSTPVLPTLPTLVHSPVQVQSLPRETVPTLDPGQSFQFLSLCVLPPGLQTGFNR